MSNKANCNSRALVGRFLASSDAAALVGLDRDQLRYRARTRAGHPQPVRLNARVWAWDARALAAFYSVSFE